jgi:hypothetical protein
MAGLVQSRPREPHGRLYKRVPNLDLLVDEASETFVAEQSETYYVTPYSDALISTFEFMTFNPTPEPDRPVLIVAFQRPKAGLSLPCI